MTIIEQLEDTVTIPLLAQINLQSSIAYISLLETFYALLIVRLMSPDTDTDKQALLVDKAVIDKADKNTPLFEQLWPISSQRELIITELASTYHIDRIQVTDLLVNAAARAYRELSIGADGKSLSAFLQPQQSAVRQYLPVWAESVIDNDFSAKESITRNLIAKKSIAETEPPIVVAPLALDEPPISAALHAKPSAYRMVEGGSTIEANSSHNLINKENPKHPLIAHKSNQLGIKVLLVSAALIAIAGLWVWFIQPNYITADEVVVVESTSTPAKIQAPAPVLAPMQLIVAVDDSGRLYSCSASVGGARLQSELMQALNTSFGEQASICELTIKSDIAERLNNTDINTLSSLFNLLRAVPFSRLQLQGSHIKLEAPDDVMLQGLLTNMRAVAPALTIKAVSPPLPANALDNNYEENTTNDRAENELSPYGNGGSTFDTLDTFDGSTDVDYQPADDLTGDSIEPAPAINYDTRQSNSLNGKDLNNKMNNRASDPSSMSESEVEALAGTTIVAEQLSNESRVE